MAGRARSWSTAGYHEGEVKVQQRAGVREQARRLVRMLDPADLSAGVATYLAEQHLAFLTARDQAGTLWIAPLSGPAGFLHAVGPAQLRIATTPGAGGPLAGLPSAQPIGLLAIDFARRRRLRVNGHLSEAGPTGLTVDVEQAYGNCSQFIQQRHLSVTTAPDDESAPPRPCPATDHLDPKDIVQIRNADTFFLGTAHPTHGRDASHRGGPSGFVRVDDERTLWWPDYPGNNMFNSLGNLAVDPVAALLFVDFATGHTLHLSGRATLDLGAVGGAGDDGRTGRRVRFQVEVRTTGMPLAARADHAHAYPRNPPLSD